MVIPQDLIIRNVFVTCVLVGLLASGGVTAAGAQSVIPQEQMRVVSSSPNAASQEFVLDGNSATVWNAFDPSGAAPPHEMIMALGGSYQVSEFRYLPGTFTRCTKYEVYVSPTNGAWGNAVAMGTWITDSSEKTASFAPTPGAFLRVRYLNLYCYAAEHNVVGVADAGGGGGGGGAAAHAALTNDHTNLANDHTNLATQIGAVSTTAEMTAQNAMIKQDIVDALAAIQVDIATLQETVDALPAGSGPCEVPPVWGKMFDGADRFVAVLDGAAYCDKETGLVWEAAPAVIGGPNNNGFQTWDVAIIICSRREVVAGRKGWALPLREQLASLMDRQSALCTGGGPCLPDDHPFSDVQSAAYWSATTVETNAANAWGVNFDAGSVSPGSKASIVGRAWCVRGGQVFDGNTHDTFPAP